jgi:hypothetical protein
MVSFPDALIPSHIYYSFKYVHVNYLPKNHVHACDLIWLYIQKYTLDVTHVSDSTVDSV